MEAKWTWFEVPIYNVLVVQITNRTDDLHMEADGGEWRPMEANGGYRKAVMEAIGRL
jgi:hypothetical protein